MDLLTHFFYHEKMLLQGRGVSVANDRPIFGCPLRSQSRRRSDNAMPFIPTERVINAFLEYTGPDGEIMGTSLDFRTGSTVTLTDLNDLGAGIASWWDTDMQPLMTAGYTLNRIKLRDMSAENSFVVDWVGILPLTGTMAGNSMPSSVAWSLKKQTGLAGRSSTRGPRIRVP